MSMGIYKITNKINNKVYIGQSVDIERRWRQHKNSSLDYPLYQAFRKYGIDNFQFEILEECKRSELNDKEIYYIKLYNSCVDGYNQTLENGCYGHPIVFTIDSLEELFDALLNSDIQKEELASLYECSERTIRDINRGISWHRDDINYPIRPYWIGKDGKKYPCIINDINPNKICPNCGGEKSRSAKLCNECAHKAQRVSDRPDAITLVNEIVSMGFCAVGRKYGVSDRAIRKWCASYNLPTKKQEIKEWLLNQ